MDGERLAPVRQGGVLQPERGVLAAHERVRNRLLQPERDERVPRLFAQRPLRLRNRARNGALQRRALDDVVADDARDLLDYVLFDAYVRSPVGRRDRHCAVRRVLDREAERIERVSDLRFGEVRPEQAAEARVGERNAGRGAFAGELVANALRGLAARRLQNEARGAAQRPLRQFRVQPLLEAQRGVRPQLERVRRPPRVDRVERRRLQQHVAGGLGHFGVRAAHHAGEPYRALRVGDHQHRRAQRVLLPVEARETLALGGGAHDDPPVVDFVQIEGVQRLPALQHYVVGDVHHVVDGAMPRVLQTLPQPVRRRPDAHASDQGAGVARAQRRVRYLYARRVRYGRARLGVIGGRLRDALAGDRRGLARDAQHGEAIAAVRRDLDLQRAAGRQNAGERRPHRALGAQNENALVLVAQPQFALRADHPGGLDAAYDRRRQLHRLARFAVGEDGADAGERDLLSGGEVRRAAHDRLRGVSGVHVREAQAVGVRMRADVRHQADDDVRPARAGAGVVGRLQPRDSEPAGQFVRGRPQRNALGEPRKRNSHAKGRCSVRWGLPDSITLSASARAS